MILQCLDDADSAALKSQLLLKWGHLSIKKIDTSREETSFGRVLSNEAIQTESSDL